MLNKSQKIAKNVAKYGWRYEVLDAWVMEHSIPRAEKSVFSQLKARTQTFSEKLAKRLWEDYGIEGIYFAAGSKQEESDSLSNLEMEALSVFRRLPNDDERRYFIDSMQLKVNDSSKGKGHTPASKSRKAA